MASKIPHIRFFIEITVIVAVLAFFAPMHAFAAINGFWDVGSTGDVNSYTYYATSTDFFQNFISKTPTGLFDVCSGGFGNSTYNGAGLNVFTDGGIGSGDCASVGNYYWSVYIDHGLTFTPYVYYQVFYDGVNVTPVNPVSSSTNATQYITIIQPTYGTTTASTTVPIDIFYSTPLVFLDNRPTTTRSYIITDAVTHAVQYSYSHVLPANSSESLRLQATVTLPVGSKILTASYLTETGSYYSEAPSVFFNVATNTYLAATGLLDPRHTPAAQTQINCASFDVGCQVQKALQFLFLPNEHAFDRFTGLWSNISTKKPFGYITVTISELKGLDMDATPAFTFPDLPFMDAIFLPMQIALGSFIWALYALHLYHNRLKQLEI